MQILLQDCVALYFMSTFNAFSFADAKLIFHNHSSLPPLLPSLLLFLPSCLFFRLDFSFEIKHFKTPIIKIIYFIYII